eukprot:m.275149 g.275149  ORF g.275149 m.275149 type:complete len:51 (+) comp40595_c0_seq3:204-356(+)
MAAQEWQQCVYDGRLPGKSECVVGQLVRPEEPRKKLSSANTGPYEIDGVA